MAQRTVSPRNTRLAAVFTKGSKGADFVEIQNWAGKPVRGVGPGREHIPVLARYKRSTVEAEQKRTGGRSLKKAAFSLYQKGRAASRKRANKK